MPWPWNRVSVRQGHWKCHHSIERNGFLLTSYTKYDSISCRFWDIQCRRISQLWNHGQGSIKVIENGTIRNTGYGFLLVFYSNLVRKTHSFWDIRLQKCRDLDNRVRRPLRSLKMSPFDRAHTTSYWRSIVTIALSRVVSEIFNVEKYCDLEIRVMGPSMSLEMSPCDRAHTTSYWRL